MTLLIIQDKFAQKYERIMKLTKIDEELKTNVELTGADLTLVQGEFQPIKSNYYQQLTKFSRQLIRALNSPTCTVDMQEYCYQQLWLTQREMVAMREKYYLIINPRIDDNGPSAS